MPLGRWLGLPGRFQFALHDDTDFDNYPRGSNGV